MRPTPGRRTRNDSSRRCVRRGVRGPEPLREIHALLAATHALGAIARQAAVRPATERWHRRANAPLSGPGPNNAAKSVKAFFAAEPPQLNDLDALHKFRIRGKELRYAMELLVAAFPRLVSDPALSAHRTVPGSARRDQRPRRRAQTIPQLEYRNHRSAHCANTCRQLVRRERKRLRRSVLRFAYWWTPGRSKQVHRRFRDSLEN